MKKSFTLLELVFIIVVVGILAAVIIPNTRSDNLREAAIQVVSHIRYTQHLAMVDDKYDANDLNWYKRRWTIRFRENLSFTSTLPPAKFYNKVWAYTIYSDIPNYAGREPDLVGMAKNPSNSLKYLSGGWDNTLHVENEKASSNMRLGEKYSIKDIKFSGGCRSNVRYIYFDYLGRPFNSSTNNSSYEMASTGWHKLLTSQCKISLCLDTCTGIASDRELMIGIEPETGYAHIL